MPAKLKALLVAFLAALSLDQATKLWVVSNLSRGDRIPLVEGFFSITHVRNPGAAFGLLNQAPAEFRLPFFVGVAVVAVVIIASFYRQLAPGDRHAALTLGLILGGAVGNLVDRLTRGEVVDFLHFRLWQGYTWPDFNVADTVIVVGVGLLLLEMVAGESDTDGPEPVGGREPVGDREAAPSD